MRILVVDDDPSVAEVVADALRARGDEPLVALDGTEALDVLGATALDGVLLDLVMPGLSGLTVLARIRSDHPTVPVVILSGRADDDQVKEAMALGAVAVLRKPTALANLADALSRLKREGPA
jgi:CheY-like chemotaxis protein